MNFIPLRSLKYSFILCAGLALAACNREPDACVISSDSQLLVGELIRVNDCSKFGFDNVIEMGNGAKFSNQKSLSYRYFTGGDFRISLTAFSKKSNKKNTAETGVSVFYPTPTQIRGKWTLTKVETREQLQVDPSISLFALPIDSSRTFNEKYDITADSIFVEHGGEEFYLFQFKNGYTYENGALLINQNTFPIVSFTSTNMVLQGPYFKGFELLYLER